MISNKISGAINARINWEFWSGYLYLSMANHFESIGRKGIANWFRIQFKEEFAHAQIFINYLNARGAKVVLSPSKKFLQNGHHLLRLLPQLSLTSAG